MKNIILIMFLLCFGTLVYGQQLSFKFTNPAVVNNGGEDYFEFTIQMKCSTAGTNLAGGTVAYDYSMDAFELSTIESNTTVTNAGLLNGANYNITAGEGTGDGKYQITIGNFSGPYDEIPTTYTDLFDVSIKIHSIYELSGIEFSTEDMNGEFYQDDFSGYTDPNAYDNNLLQEPLGAVSTWTGGTNVTWNNTGNWDTDSVPRAGTVVIIPRVPGGNSPILGLGTTEECYSLTLEPDAELTNNGTLNVITDMDMQATSGFKNASFVEGTAATTTVGGDATFQQWLTPGLWHNITPVNNGAVGSIFDGMYLRYWDEGAEAWSDYLTNPDASLTKMLGYQVWTDAASVVDFSGDLYTGSHSISLTRNGTGSFAGFNLVGNPYPSSIDWDSGDLTKTNISGTVYSWRGVAGNYATYNSATGGTNGGTNNIAPSQAFFLYVESGSTSGSFGVTNGARVHSDQTIFKNANEYDFGLVRFGVSGENGYSDECLIGFKNDATFNYDSDYDAFKLAGSGDAPQLYTRSADERDLAINLQPGPGEQTEIPLFFEMGEDDVYDLELMELANLDDYQNIYLQDLKTGVVIDLREQSAYSFTAAPNDDPLRFKMAFGPTAIPESMTNNNIRIYSLLDNIVVEMADQDLPATIRVYNMQGQLVDKRKLTKQTTTIDLDTRGGWYAVLVVAGSSEKTQRVFLK
ncbi:MAG: T9SS type A sorting domain-containing protein [Bacteroidales bacterium]|nr:T9SS type A sorting domain-containing protein [Bacteroidales bacterium]